MLNLFLSDDEDSGDGDINFDDASSTANSSSNYSTINSQSTGSYNHSQLNDKRKSRNQNEKKRRDQFNFLIQGLGNCLNHPRKIDKATVLSETLFFFRNYNGKFPQFTRLSDMTRTLYCFFFY
jgi:hypothetical protein